MAVPGFGRAEYSDRTAVAQPFQCRDEHSELAVRIPWHVLSDDTIRPALIHAAHDMADEEPVVVLAEPLSGNAVGLTGIARSEDMNEATPRSSVEGGEVGPDRSRMKPPRFHRRDQRSGGSGFPLHCTDEAASLSPIAESEVDSELESADAGTDGEDIPGTNSHVTAALPAPVQVRCK